MKRIQALFLCIIILCSGAYAGVFKRIVSLDVAVTEEIFMLGCADSLAGRGRYCIKPPEAALKEEVGSITDIDVEKVVMLKPDIVIVSTITDKKKIRSLNKAGINVEVLPPPRDFPALCSQFMYVAGLLGREKEAEKIISAAWREVVKTEREVSALPKVKVFVQVGSHPLFTMGEGTFIGDYIRMAGGINIAGDVSGGIYSREKVVEENPSVILITSMGIEGKREKGIWERFKTVDAVRNGRIYLVDAYSMCSPTPAGFARLLHRLSVLLHKNG